MNKVYLFHIYGPSSENHYKEHADNIRRLNPEKIFIWGDTEYCVDFILREFIKNITPWLEENNKTITVIGIGFNRKITDNIVVDCGPGYYTTTYPHLTRLHGDKNFDDTIINSDKLFTLYCHRGTDYRAAIVDAVVRENLLIDGIVTYHGGYEDASQYVWKYHDGSRMIDEEEFTHSAIEFDPLDFPKSYFRGLADIISETQILDGNYLPSEKTTKSVIALKPFLVLSCPHYHRYLYEDFGIEMYDEIFDYSFDSMPDVNDRIDGILENVKRLRYLSKQEIKDKIFDKIVRNKQKYLDYADNFEKMFPQSLRFLIGNMDKYEIVGELWGSFNTWLHMVKEKGWLK
jgi:hypothetical protein